MDVIAPSPLNPAGNLLNSQMAIGMAADAERLNALDDVWTAYLAAEPEPATVSRDLPALRALVAEMCELLVRLARSSRELRGVLSELPMDLDEELRRVLRAHPAGEALLDDLPDGPFAEQVAVACSIVEEEAPGEIEVLRAKVEKLAVEGHSPGDLGGRLKCAVILAGGGAGLIGLVVAPVALIPGLALSATGHLIGTLVSAAGWNCRRAGDVAAANA